MIRYKKKLSICSQTAKKESKNGGCMGSKIYCTQPKSAIKLFQDICTSMVFIQQESEIRTLEQNQGEKKKRRNMLYPEKEKRSSQGGSVILQDKNTNCYPIRLCQRSFKDVYGSSFQSVVPRHKTSTTPGNLLEMQNLRCPLILRGWGPAIWILTRSQVLMVHGQLEAAQVLIHGVHATCRIPSQICTTGLWAPEPEHKSPEADGPMWLICKNWHEIVPSRGTALGSFLL